MMKIINGIGASEGYGIGTVFVKKALGEVPSYVHVSASEEFEKLESGIKKTKEQLEKLYMMKKVDLGEEKARIFKAHQMILDDPELIGSIQRCITSEGVNCEKATHIISEQFAKLFEEMDNVYMRERASDIRDVRDNLLKHLMGIKDDLSDIPEKSIIIANDLTPSDTAQLDVNKVLGFVTEVGGKTSHSAIIARTLGLPAVMGIKDLTMELESETAIIIDGFEGKVILDPNDEMLSTYIKKMEQYEAEKVRLLKYKEIKLTTRDGKHIEVSGNIAKPEDAYRVLEQGGEGIGLFRSEFIYMDRTEAPSEEEQFEVYKKVLTIMEDRPVIIRTMDIGGDKEIPYLHMEKELNPFLGYRAIRYCLDHLDILKTQLRALLRASVHGKLRIMFPMISTVDEVIRLKSVLNSCKDELRLEGVEVSDRLEVGIMIEVPSAAIMSDELAKEVDFFSIGTNDLTQYTLATDRMNSKLDYLYNNDDPAVLRLIKLTINNAHGAGIWCGMCGSAAGRADLIPTLLEYGLDEFSMSSGNILKAKEIISQQL